MGVIDQQDHKQAVQLVCQELKNIDSYVTSHGGKIIFDSLDEQGIVYIKLLGTCQACPLSMYTVTMGIEARLKRKSSYITAVEVLEGDEE